MKKEVVLVDRNNRKVGVAEKIKAHKAGLLHRAFSIFVFNSKGELLLQRRNIDKYHSGGLWSNTVCSHPEPYETYYKAIHRRLKEEMGFDCRLKRAFSFVYKTRLDNGLIEYEHDTVFIGRFDGEPSPDPEEVMDYKWVCLDALKEDLTSNPDIYSVWFKIAIDMLPTETLKMF
jgi:isopentenyl-diphosphate delta-isomerase